MVKLAAKEPLAAGPGFYRVFLEFVTSRVETDAFFPIPSLHPIYTQTHTSLDCNNSLTRRIEID